jgi:enamine deaminase RidA (YjgF/YER057c/UK114 family)
MRPVHIFAALLALALLAWPADNKKKKKKKEDQEPVTQVLEIPKDPPMTVTAETSRLVFDLSPLSAKGLLSQQVRDALRALQGRARGASFLKLRAFVAGSGDLRRVRDIVSETFTERRQPLPALSVVQVGGLPMEGAQVIIESIASARREMNPHGLAFIAGQAASANDPLAPIPPLAAKAIENLGTALRGAGAETEDVLRVTCFLTLLDGVNDVRTLVAKHFPAAIANYVQVQRAPERGIAECEAVARLRAKPAAPLVFVNPEGLPKSPNFSQVAQVGAPKVVLSGIQMAFHFQESDARLAFDRLKKALEEGGSSARDVAFTSLYPLSSSIADLVRKVRFDYFDKSRPPAATMLPFEGLPSMDAAFAIDVVAIPR